MSIQIERPQPIQRLAAYTIHQTDNLPTSREAGYQANMAQLIEYETMLMFNSMQERTNLQVIVTFKDVAYFCRVALLVTHRNDPTNIFGNKVNKMNIRLNQVHYCAAIKGNHNE